MQYIHVHHDGGPQDHTSRNRVITTQEVLKKWNGSMPKRVLDLCRWVEKNLQQDQLVEFVGDAGLLAFSDNQAAVKFAIDLQTEMRRNYEVYEFVIRVGVAECKENVYSHILRKETEKFDGICKRDQTLYYGQIGKAEELESNGVPAMVNLCPIVYKSFEGGSLLKSFNSDGLIEPDESEPGVF